MTNQATTTTLNINVTVALRMSATQAARKLGKSHAEAWWPKQQGFNLAHLAIPAAQRDISAYNRDVLASPKVADADMEAAATFYGEVFAEEYDKAYTRWLKADSFSPEQQLAWCIEHGATVQFHSPREVSINIVAIRWSIFAESLEAAIQQAEKALREGATPFSL